MVYQLYHFKYVNKGPDKATIVIEKNGSNAALDISAELERLDKIKIYLDYRYVYLLIAVILSYFIYICLCCF